MQAERMIMIDGKGKPGVSVLELIKSELKGEKQLKVICKSDDNQCLIQIDLQAFLDAQSRIPDIKYHVY